MADHHSFLAWGLVLFLPACTADLSSPFGGDAEDERVATGGSDSVSPAAECVTPSAGPSPLRRLTRFEYNNTVRDLLGDTSRPASEFPPEEVSSGFDNNAQTLRVSLLLAEQYLDAAQALAAHATQDLETQLGCDPSVDEANCARQFINDFASRAYRRPVTPEQEARLLAVFERARADFDLVDSIQQVIAVVLQAPHFLYRIEADGGAGDRSLDPYELASRLSYLLWGSQPDESLLDAAQAGLAGPDQVREQALRMMEDERFVDGLNHFHEQWLGLDEIEHAEKDTALFPQWTEELRHDLMEESRLFLSETVKADGSLGDLLTQPVTYLNGPLAEFYGLSGPSGEIFERVDLDPNRYAGLLTQGSLMATHAKPSRSEPIFRGVFIRTALLCDPPPPPPPGVTAEVNVDPNATGRERLESHREDPACRGCHALFDPIGFAFENFDAVGRYRETEKGAPIDASGALAHTDVDGEFIGPVELAHLLKDSAMPRECLVGKWFTYAYGRTETAEDACNVEQLEERLSDSGGSMKELILELTQTEAFLNKSASEAGDN